jgi:hypothetical protein
MFLGFGEHLHLAIFEISLLILEVLTIVVLGLVLGLVGGLAPPLHYLPPLIVHTNGLGDSLVHRVIVEFLRIVVQI